MSQWNELAQWMYGDVQTGKGFWYSHPLYEIRELNEEQLFWVPDEVSLCMIWHAGHIAHRERLHIGKIVQGLEEEIIPPQYEVFGLDWCTPDAVRNSIDSVENVKTWIREVREKSNEFIASLKPEEFHKAIPTEHELTIGHWLFITAGHCSVHIGKLQLLRHMLEGTPDNPC